MSLTTQDKQDIGIIVDTAIKKGVKDGIAHLPTVEMVRNIVHEELDTAIKPLGARVSKLEISYNSLETKVTRLEEFAEDAKHEIYKVGVLLEDSNSRIQTIAESVNNYLKLSIKVDKHEFRLQYIESIQPLMIKTLKLHSKKLSTV